MNNTLDLQPEHLEFIVDRAGIGIFVIDRGLRVLLWNRFMADHSGHSAKDMVGRNLLEVFPELPGKWLEKKVAGVFLLGNSAFTSWEQRPFLFRFAHGRPITGGIDCMYQSCTFLPMKDEHNKVSAVCVALADATDTAIAYQNLECALDTVRANARRDGLTGLYNRHHLEERVAEEFGRMRRYGGTLSLVMFDIDHFKRVNDVHGHLAGDQVLRMVADRISGVIRETDILGRYGGEEFCALLPGTELTGARIFAEKLREVVCAQPIRFKDVALAVTVSCGVAQALSATMNYEELIRLADTALYRAKNEGRNRVCA